MGAQSVRIARMPLFRRKKALLALLADQAEKLLEALAALEECVLEPDREKGERVVALAGETSERGKKVVDALDSSRSRAGREEVFKLCRALDGMADFSKAAADAMTLYGVPTSEPLVKIAEAVRTEGIELAAALGAVLRDPGGSEESLVRAKRAAGFAGTAARDALAELLKSPNVVTILKTKELYKHLSEAADRGDEAADIIGDIRVKST